MTISACYSSPNSNIDPPKAGAPELARATFNLILGKHRPYFSTRKLQSARRVLAPPQRPLVVQPRAGSLVKFGGDFAVSGFAMSLSRTLTKPWLAGFGARLLRDGSVASPPAPKLGSLPHRGTATTWVAVPAAAPASRSGWSAAASGNWPSRSAPPGLPVPVGACFASWGDAFGALFGVASCRSRPAPFVVSPSTAAEIFGTIFCSAG